MAQAKNNQKKKPNNGANVGYEAELWQMADALRGSMDAAERDTIGLTPPETMRLILEWDS